MGTAALALGGAGAGAATVIGSADSVTAPEVQRIHVELTERATDGAPALAAKGRRPKIVYLQGESTIDPSVGAYADVTLFSRACRGRGRLLGGGAVADNADVFQQGTYIVPKKGEYHVVLGFDDAAAESPASYEIASHLICARGVR